MMKHNSSNHLFVLVVVIGILLVACSPKPTEAPVEAPSSGGEFWPVEKDITIPEGGSLPNITLSAGTKVTPKSAEGKVDLEEIPPSDIGTSLPALPEGKKALAVVDITPDGMRFSSPIQVRFKLPSGHGYSAGDILEMMQHDKDSDIWLPAGEAEVDGDEKCAIGKIAHTSVFALVEPGGVPTAVPVAVRVSVASLLDDLDSMLEIGDYAAMVVYFPEEIGGETVDALTAYIEEQGYDGETFWGALPPGTDLSDTEIERDIRQAGEYDSCVILSIDLSDSNNTYLVFVANTVRAEGGGPFIVFQMDTYTGEVTQLADID